MSCRSSVMSELLVLNCTLTGGASTVTVSSIPPTDNVRSAVTSPRCCTRTFLCSRFLNPASSALIVYVPGSTKSNRYLPSAPVTRTTTTPVASLVSVIVAPGSADLLSSVTLPCSRPR